MFYKYMRLVTGNLRTMILERVRIYFTLQGKIIFTTILACTMQKQARTYPFCRISGILLESLFSL